MGKLTTHILDTSLGVPASNVAIELYRIHTDRFMKLNQTYSNADGRTNAPMLDEHDFIEGCYELRFYVGDYFNKRESELAEPLFLDVIPIRFSMSSGQHYHVPLLVSPWAYSTYRGS